MSLDHAFFYKSVNGDRVYDDASFEHWLKKFFTSGVFLNDLQVTANEDMTVTVGAGYVNADGKVKIFESASSLIIETAGATYPRIDSIVLERNDTERDILLKVVKGGYSSEPVAHTPVRQDGVYQLVIAQILVNAGAVKVTQANITDTRNNTELCGIVAGAVDQIDFSQIQAQFDSYFAQYKTQMETDFTVWFQNIRNQLDEDAAGHLQNQIGNLETLNTENKGNLVEAVNELEEENINIVERLDNGDIDTLTSIEQVIASTEPEKPVGAGAVKELNDSLDSIGSSSETLTNKITIIRIGKIRILNFFGSVVDNGTNFLTLPQADTPRRYVCNNVSLGNNTNAIIGFHEGKWKLWTASMQAYTTGTVYGEIIYDVN